MTETPYSRSELRTRAKEALGARESGDPRYLELLTRLAFVFEVHPGHVEQEIMRLAEEE